MRILHHSRRLPTVTERFLAFICDEIASLAFPPNSNRRVCVMSRKRTRFKQTASFKDRLAAFSKEMREKAEFAPPGQEREDLLRRASQADTAAHLDDWASSPPLQPSK